MWVSGGSTVSRYPPTDLMADQHLLSSPGLSFQCPAAQVVAVYEKAVAPHQPKLARYANRILTQHEHRRVHPDQPLRTSDTFGRDA